MSEPDDSDASEHDEHTDLPGKNSFNLSKSSSLTTTQMPSQISSSNNSNLISNKKYNNIMLIKNEQIVSNTSSIKAKTKKPVDRLKNLNMFGNDKDKEKPMSDVKMPAMKSLNNLNLNNVGNNLFDMDQHRQHLHTDDPDIQQQPNLGVSDRMSKEKQKFFRFSAFNCERKTKLNNNNNNNNSNNKNNNSNGSLDVTSQGLLNNHVTPSQKNQKKKQKILDKYEFVSSEDSDQEDGENVDEEEEVEDEDIEVEKICDKNQLLNNTKSNLTVNNLNNLNLSNFNSNSLKSRDKVSRIRSRLSSDEAESSCCTSEEEGEGERERKGEKEEEDSSSDSESSSSDDGTSTSSSEDGSKSSSSSCTSDDENTDKKIEALNKAESLINNKNVFAYINSRELQKQSSVVYNRSYCWTSMPFVKPNQSSSNSLFQQEEEQPPVSFTNTQKSPEVWGFAAEAKKTVNIFNNSQIFDSGSQADNESDLDHRRRDPNVRKKNCRRNMDGNCKKGRSQKRSPIKKHSKNPEFLLSSRKENMLASNSMISSEDEKQLSPSKLVKQAINYKKYDTNTLNNKKLIMDLSFQNHTSEVDDADDEHAATASKLLPTPMKQQSQPPYNNNQSDMGKKTKKT